MKEKEYRLASSARGGLLFLKGVPGVAFGDRVVIRDHRGKKRNGQVIQSSQEVVMVQVLEGTDDLNLDDTWVRFMDEPFEMPLSPDLLGRIFNGIGRPMDDRPPIVSRLRKNVNGSPVNPVARAYPREFIQTGISAIDGLNSLVRGQKLPIFSGSGLSHNRLAAQIVRQAKLLGEESRFVVVFAAMGVSYSDARFFREDFESNGVLGNVVMFVNLADDLALALKDSGAKVGLLDADVYGPSIPKMLGDDGRIMTSRNASGYGEPLYGVTALLPANCDKARVFDGNVLDEYIKTPGSIQQATINVSGELTKAVNLTPFSFDPTFNGQWDEFTTVNRKTVDDQGKPDAHNADDIIFGGLGDDWLHGGSGDDAILGGEALAGAYTQVYNNDGELTGIARSDYNRPFNPVDALRYNPLDADGWHYDRTHRAGEFALYDEYDPLRKIMLNADGTATKDEGGGVEWFLNFAADEGTYVPAGTIPDATGQQATGYPEAWNDGGDRIFGDTDCILERELIGSAMTFYDNAIQSQQGSSIITTRIDPFGEAFEYRHRNHCCKFRQQVALEALLEEVANHLCNTFRTLQRDIPDKAIGNNNIDRAIKNIVALDIPHIVEVALIQ